MVVCSYRALQNWGGGELGPLELKREKEVGGEGWGHEGLHRQRQVQAITGMSL